MLGLRTIDDSSLTGRNEKKLINLSFEANHNSRELWFSYVLYASLLYFSAKFQYVVRKEEFIELLKVVDELGKKIVWIKNDR